MACRQNVRSRPAATRPCHRRLIACIALFALLTITSAEIPTKGKHTRIHDAQHTSVEDADLPRFAEPIANVTVSIGRDALLACVVENLKGYKVAWVRVDTQTILSIHHNVISQNSRISLTYNDHRSWYLHIKDVEETDRGWYMCQVNTDPMRSRKGYLQVVVPPMIVEGMTSNDMVVREGLNVTLMCKARGYPEPYVMWRREDGEEMLIGGEHVNVVDGELLHITKVSRLHMAAYLCVASNGVPPSISKRVHLRVQFPPMLSIPNQLEGAYVGQDVVLECHTEAYPASINYWTTERGDMIISDTSRAGDKYETTSTISGYMKFMKLKIRSVGANDFGTYRCVAKNSLGETDGNIKLDEMPAPTTAIISEMAMLNRSLDGKRRHRNKYNMNALPDYGVEEWRDGAGGNGLGGAGGNSAGGIGGDNNQTPVRNPPGAFHNSAGALAQRNLLARIIHGIKTQSVGLFGRLSSYARALLEAVGAGATAMDARTTAAAVGGCATAEATEAVDDKGVMRWLLAALVAATTTTMVATTTATATALLMFSWFAAATGRRPIGGRGGNGDGDVAQRRLTTMADSTAPRRDRRVSKINKRTLRVIGTTTTSTGNASGGNGMTSRTDTVTLMKRRAAATTGTRNAKDDGDAIRVNNRNCGQNKSAASLQQQQKQQPRQQQHHISCSGMADSKMNLPSISRLACVLFALLVVVVIVVVVCDGAGRYMLNRQHGNNMNEASSSSCLEVLEGVLSAAATPPNSFTSFAVLPPMLFVVSSLAICMVIFWSDATANEFHYSTGTIARPSPASLSLLVWLAAPSAALQFISEKIRRAADVAAVAALSICSSRHGHSSTTTTDPPTPPPPAAAPPRATARPTRTASHLTPTAAAATKWRQLSLRVQISSAANGGGRRIANAATTTAITTTKTTTTTTRTTRTASTRRHGSSTVAPHQACR